MDACAVPHIASTESVMSKKFRTSKNFRREPYLIYGLVIPNLKTNRDGTRAFTKGEQKFVERAIDVAPVLAGCATSVQVVRHRKELGLGGPPPDLKLAEAGSHDH
jgi:hypothetical protein